MKIQPPSLRHFALEPLTFIELPRLLAAAPQLARQRRGNGDPVLVLPGYGTSNASTVLLRSYLSWLGYSVYGWRQGRNRGDIVALFPHVRDEVQQLQHLHRRPVHLIGWSLGGVLARELAREHPDSVQQVITMGSPIIGGPKYTSLARLAQREGVDLDEIERMIAAREAVAIQVPVTSIYSRRDGIVGCRASIDHHTPNARHFEVNTTHLGFGQSPEVFKLLAARLRAI